MVIDESMSTSSPISISVSEEIEGGGGRSLGMSSIWLEEELGGRLFGRSEGNGRGEGEEERRPKRSGGGSGGVNLVVILILEVS